jgi:hypothetical protein
LLRLIEPYGDNAIARAWMATAVPCSPAQVDEDITGLQQFLVEAGKVLVDFGPVVLRATVERDVGAGGRLSEAQCDVIAERVRSVWGVGSPAPRHPRRRLTASDLEHGERFGTLWYTLQWLGPTGEDREQAALGLRELGHTPPEIERCISEVARYGAELRSVYEDEGAAHLADVLHEAGQLSAQQCEALVRLAGEVWTRSVA